MERREFTKCYLVVDERDEYELPLGCFRSMQQAASFCGCSYGELWYALNNHSLIYGIMSVCVCYVLD